MQLGLRESFDFDFCVPEQFNNEVLIEELSTLGKIEVKQNYKGTCDVLLNGIQISFFYYPNNILGEIVKTEEIPNLQIASILDIAIMKIVAIGGRGAKKDFFDLYQILNKCDIELNTLAAGLLKKCGANVNYANIVMGLSYFEDAEQEILPKTFVEYNWEKIKEFFVSFQQKFYEELEKMGV